MTKHFSFSTDLIFFFSFLYLFNIFFLIHLLFQVKFTGCIVEKKISPGCSDRNKQFFSLARDLGKVGIPNLEQMLLIKYCSVLQNVRVTVLPFSNYGKTMLWKNQQRGGGRGKITLSTPPRLKICNINTPLSVYFKRDI